MERAEFLLDKARRAGASSDELAKIGEQVKALKGVGFRDLRGRLQSQSTLLGDARPSAASRANVETAINALTKDHHWAAREMRSNLVQMIERNGRIPDAYKPQLRHDVATVLRMCPHAGGLARELTLRGQRGATGSASKLGSQSNAGVGAAYEIMGAAALANGGSRAVNSGAPTLHINVGSDIVTFGDKAFINGRPGNSGEWISPTRGTIECDVRIGRSTPYGFREIGIDFKHSSENGSRHSSADLKNQVENVVEAIRDGQLHEYHFVTNGSFGSGFKEVVAQANTELSRSGEALIGLHEHVHTLGSDPTANL